MRKQNWPIILEQMIDEWKEKPFAWGSADCLHFAMLTAQSLIERDVVSQFAERNSYSTEDEGRNKLNEFFSGDYANIFNEVFSFVGTFRKAQRGDLAIVEINDQKVCAIIDNTGRHAVCKTLDGLIFIPARLAMQVWRVE